MSKRLTLKEIAEAAGVSEMTASRALRNVGHISKETQEKVRRIAAELGYVRNKIAGSLASNSVDLVGVVIPSVKSYVFSEVLDGISTVLAPTRLRPVFGLTNYDLETEEEVINEMLSWRPSGLIVAGLEHTENARLTMKNAGIPVVEIMDTDGDAVDLCVGISHREAGAAMARAIHAKGKRKIGFIGTKINSDFRAKKRLEGFIAELERLGLELAGQALYSEGSTVAKGRELTAKLLSENPELDCIYYSTDVGTIGGLMHCIAAGISVPNQLALAGFNNLNMLEGMPMELATIDSKRFEIGRIAAEMILDRLDAEKPNPTLKQELQSLVIQGDSL
ncbi:transcriptional regulator, LacI family protein [Rhodobacterales bacterium HTCC2150]|nr:transcriptional regulator, LacI family protein [Rhodobacterales bacterium HTCC2150] [Rhodobacteraceae bacterium HTCC2150]